MSEALFEYRLQQLYNAVEEGYPLYVLNHLDCPDFCPEKPWADKLRFEMEMTRQKLKDYGAKK